MEGEVMERRPAGNMTGDGKNEIRRIIEARSRILMKHPFYGMLLMRLRLGLAACGTACTDMTNLLFDPSFARALSDGELEFVMLHEVLHCVLQHCRRGKGFHGELFNTACDIVVNSAILYFLGQAEFTVMGSPAMHLAPDGREGYLYTAEQVYAMLVQKDSSGGEGKGMQSPDGSVKGAKGGTDPAAAGNTPEEGFARIDSHEIWRTISELSDLGDQWDAAVKEAADKAAARGYSPEDFPPSVREYIMDLEHKARVDWRNILQEFIQLHSDRFDYSFSPPDKRFSESDFILPAFSEEQSEALENIWFCIDASGSISSEILSEILSEIRQAVLLFSEVSVKISFFDTKVTEPVLCDDEEMFMDITPVGGGGTSFRAIFRYMRENMAEDLPVAVIILTDGYCVYPGEKEAMGVPVLWIIYDNPKDAPWGKSVHVEVI